MNNTTSIGLDSSNGISVMGANYDLELVGVIQSGASFIATMIILFRVMDFGSFFKTIRLKREKQKKAKELKELERVRKIINSVKNHEDVNINDLLSDDDNEDTEQPNDVGVMRIARKKQHNSVV